MYSTTIETGEGQVRISGEPREARLRLEIQPKAAECSRSCETDFPLQLIEYLVDKVGCHGLANLINRFDDQTVLQIVKSQLFSYFRPEEFRKKRVLDFGCGHGISTLELAKLLPESEILGVDLIADRIEIAQKIADLKGVSNARFLRSPSAVRLPNGIGQFDYVMLCAVYEHLLPAERRKLMPLIWFAMREGGSIFINQTPYRYFPFEHHSTGLWFINFMPDRMAHFVARRFAKNDPSNYNRAIQTSPEWEDHLRGGLRGATEWEIVHNLTRDSRFKAHILQPRVECARDRADHWLQATGEERFHTLKMFIACTFRITDRLFGTVPSMNIDVVIRKGERIEA